MDPILDDLNDEQRRAVLHGEGPLMVLAGAGSGKTRVITRRVARLIRDDGVDPYRILALTFTNKAAAEMRERVLRLGGSTVQVSTFHAACARFLRRDIAAIGWPRDFTIYDTYDRDQCLKGLMKSHEVKTSLRPADVGREISRLKNLHVRPEELPPVRNEVDQVVSRLYGPYEARMKQLGALDFDDLLLKFLDLLRLDPEVGARYRARFEHVLVDEFQDTNRVQYELTKALLGERQNVCVVGDPDQSIYRFRGAELRNMLDFERDFPRVTFVRLEQNYRSTSNILHAAEAVIENNDDRFEKKLRTEAEAGEQLQVVKSGSPQEEAENVARRIAARLADGAGADEVAVFYRTHFLSRAVEEALRHAGIPYEVVGGWAFFERREIKDLLAYLRVAANPLDEVSFERIVNVPARGLGDVALDKLRSLAVAGGMSPIEAIAEPDVRMQFSAKQRQGLESLHAALEAVREAGRGSAADALRAALRETDYVGWACKLGEPEDEARKENLEELVSDATTFDSTAEGGLSAYLQHVSLLTSEDRRDDDGPRVSLMTVHSAKGLEFDHVLVIGLEEGLFPHSRAREDRTELEEERRLMYVALTRARKTLFLSAAARRMVNGTFQTQMHSRFLDEIPDECLAQLSARKQRFENWETDGDQDPGPWVEDRELRIGACVRQEFGRGRIKALLGRGIQSRALVEFETSGERTLMLEWAKLVVIPEGELDG